MFREQGCHENEYETAFVSQVRQGIRNVLPCQADKRRAFLLPHQIHTKGFKKTASSKDPTLRMTIFATILCFVGMLRPHTLHELKLSSFTLIRKHRKMELVNAPKENIAKFFKNHDTTELTGFIIEFKSKTMPVARAYFPNLSSTKSHYSAMCSVKAMASVARAGILNEKSLKSVGKGPRVRKFLQQLTGAKKPVPLYALRIGGRTWNISQGLDRQFVDYLGTWKSPEASARYYREEPTAVLRKLRRFYDNLPDPQSM